MVLVYLGAGKVIDMNSATSIERVQAAIEMR
jgi:hypothetical protein